MGAGYVAGRQVTLVWPSLPHKPRVGGKGGGSEIQRQTQLQSKLKNNPACNAKVARGIISGTYEGMEGGETSI